MCLRAELSCNRISVGVGYPRVEQMTNHINNNKRSYMWYGTHSSLQCIRNMHGMPIHIRVYSFIYLSVNGRLWSVAAGIHSHFVCGTSPDRLELHAYIHICLYIYLLILFFVCGMRLLHIHVKPAQFLSFYHYYYYYVVVILCRLVLVIRALIKKTTHIHIYTWWWWWWNILLLIWAFYI